MNADMFRRQFNKVKRIAELNQRQSAKLDIMINKEFGFSYSDKDFESAIDTLDYGTDNLSFEDFIIGMKELKEKGKTFK